MADFCKYCSIEVFGEDFRDMANISKLEDTNQDKFASVLCEDCGYCQVDHNGICITHESCVAKIEDVELRKKYSCEKDL